MITDAPGTRVERSTIERGTTAGLGNGGAGISASNSTGLTIDENLIEGNLGSGIDLEDGSDYSTINSNTIGDTASGAANLGYGILVRDSSGAVIGGVAGLTFGNTSVGDIIEGNTAGGILLEGTDGGEVLNSQIENNGGVGVAFMTTTVPAITDDLIAANTGGGVLLEDSLGRVGHFARLRPDRHRK